MTQGTGRAERVGQRQDRVARLARLARLCKPGQRLLDACDYVGITEKQAGNPSSGFVFVGIWRPQLLPVSSTLPAIGHHEVITGIKEVVASTALIPGLLSRIGGSS